MNVRLYFWFRGSDRNRPGGPWWYRDFHNADERTVFLDDIVSFLFAYCEEDSLPAHDLMKIRPPDESKIVWMK